MQVRGHDIIQINNFKGRYNRGPDNNVPADYALDEANLMFTEKGVKTRLGFGDIIHPSFSFTPVFTKAFALNGVQYTLSVDGSGNFKDSGGTTILTIATAVAFNFCTSATRVYFSPLANDGNPVAAEFVYVWDGVSATARKAAAAGPTAGTFAAAASAGAGNIDKGNYIISVAFETDSGFITEFSNNIILYAAPASKKIDLSNIPTGPAGTAARRIVISKVFHKAYSNNYKDYEMFFAIGGRIANNTATTLTLNFYSNDLSDSADYLIDQISEIPAAKNIIPYSNRFVYCGEDTYNGVLVSAAGSPESVSSVDGFIVLASHSVNKSILNGVEHQGNLYLFTFGQTYVTADNGLEPSSWGLTLLDSGNGTQTTGVARTYSQQSSISDYIFIANKGGLYGFNGVFNQVPLSYVIDDDWQSEFNSIYLTVDLSLEILHDAARKRVYVRFGGTSLYMMDYQNGITPEKVRWSKWTSQATMCNILLNQFNSTVAPFIAYQRSGKQYVTTMPEAPLTTYLQDDGNKGIQAIYRTAYVPQESLLQIYHWDCIRVYAEGSGAMQQNLYTDDPKGPVTPTLGNLTLGVGSIHYYETRLIFQGTKLAVEFKVNNAFSNTSNYFTINRLELFAKPTGQVYPG